MILFLKITAIVVFLLIICSIWTWFENAEVRQAIRDFEVWKKEQDRLERLKRWEEEEAELDRLEALERAKK